MGYSSWRTPRKEGSHYQRWNDEFHFTMDAAASHANTLLNRYCTEEGKFERHCQQTGCTDCLLAGDCLDFRPVKIAETTGLDPESWVGERVFNNPPYDDTLKDWMLIANMHVAEMSLSLLPPSIDTAWFDGIWPAEGATATIRHEKDYHSVVFYYPPEPGKPLWIERELRFYKGRMRFEHPATGYYVLPDGTILHAEMFDDMAEDAEWVWDENDPESIPGAAPRAGNLVVVHYQKGQGIWRPKKDG